MPSYTAPTKDMQFVLHDLLNVIASPTSPAMSDLEADFTSAVLEEAGKITSEVLAPLNVVGDERGLFARQRCCPRADRFQGSV